MPRSRHPRKAREEVIAAEELSAKKTVRLIPQDGAGFGRINKSKYCRCEKGARPSAPCHHIREYRYAYGAVEPLTGGSSFLVPCCDGAAWHKSKILQASENIRVFFLSPYTPEVDPIDRLCDVCLLRWSVVSPDTNVCCPVLIRIQCETRKRAKINDLTRNRADDTLQGKGLWTNRRAGFGGALIYLEVPESGPAGTPGFLTWSR